MANTYGTYTSLSGNANALVAAGFASLGVIDFGETPPHECFVQLRLQASTTPTGVKGCTVYARSSLDGTAFSDSGSTANELNLTNLGFVSLADTSAHISKAMPIAPAFGGCLPTKVEILIKNDSGVALASSGQTGAYRAETLG